MRLLEPIEQGVLRRLRHAHAGILHLDPQAGVVGVADQAHPHLDTPGLGEFHRVADDIEKALPKPDGIDIAPPDRIG